MSFLPFSVIWFDEQGLEDAEKINFFIKNKICQEYNNVCKKLR